MSNTAPSDWNTSQLGKEITLVMGQSPPSTTYNTKRNGLPFFQGKADFGTKYPIASVWCDVPQKIAEKGSILFSVRAPVGEINVSKERSCIGRGLAAISTEKLSIEYLFYLLDQKKPIFQKLAQGSTFEAIKGSELKEIEIAVPPLKEQQKIAEILTSVDEVIENTQSQIDKLEDLKKATMNELLTKGIGHTEFKETEIGRIPKSWELFALNQIINSVTGGVSVNSEDRQISENEIGVLKTSAVFKGMFYSSEHKTVLSEDHQRVNTSVKSDTIIFSRMNTPELVGESGYVSQSNPRLYLPDRLWALEVGNKGRFSTKWLSFVLSSTKIRSDIKMLATGTSNSMKNISKPNLLSIVIATPPIAEQIKISECLSACDDLILKNKSRHLSVASLKKSLMQDLLTGKVRVKVN